MNRRHTSVVCAIYGFSVVGLSQCLIIHSTISVFTCSECGLSSCVIVMPVCACDRTVLSVQSFIIRPTFVVCVSEVNNSAVGRQRYFWYYGEYNVTSCKIRLRKYVTCIILAFIMIGGCCVFLWLYTMVIGWCAAADCSVAAWCAHRTLQNLMISETDRRHREFC